MNLSVSLELILILTIGLFFNSTAFGDCGLKEIVTRSDLSHLTGGTEAPLGGWPWQVRLGVRMNNGDVSWMCGGSIISQKYVLTAAHCIEAGPNAQYVVRVGGNDVNRFESGQEDIPVLRVRIHQQYVKEDNFANDIAILRLARPIVLKAQVSPVCLPGINDDPTPGRSCYVTGWGLIGSGNAPFSNVLREGKVSIISRDLCRQGRLWGNSVKNTNICAGYLNGKVDACKGDSGGPLVCQDLRTGRWILEGLVSFGWDRGCGFPGKPAVYTRVGSYVDWIHTVTGNSIKA